MGRSGVPLGRVRPCSRFLMYRLVFLRISNRSGLYTLPSRAYVDVYYLLHFKVFSPLIRGRGSIRESALLFPFSFSTDGLQTQLKYTPRCRKLEHHRIPEVAACRWGNHQVAVGVVTIGAIEIAPALFPAMRLWRSNLTGR